MELKTRIGYAIWREKDGHRVILWGGRPMEKGCVATWEPLTPLVAQNYEWGRCLATLGRVAIVGLAAALGSDEASVSMRIEPSQIGLDIYECLEWNYDEWIKWAKQVVSVDDVLRYPSLGSWCALSWPIEFSPFDYETTFEHGGRPLLRWQGVGDDWSNLSIEVYQLSEDVIRKRLNAWAFGIGCRLEEWSPEDAEKHEPWNSWNPFGEDTRKIG